MFYINFHTFCAHRTFVSLFVGESLFFWGIVFGIHEIFGWQNSKGKSIILSPLHCSSMSFFLLLLFGWLAGSWCCCCYLVRGFTCCLPTVLFFFCCILPILCCLFADDAVFLFMNWFSMSKQSTVIWGGVGVCVCVEWWKMLMNCLKSLIKETVDCKIH